MTSGELRRMVEEDGLGGMTSNPSIFEKAIAGGEEYADYLAQLRTDKTLDAKGIYERLAIRDIQDAADVLRPVYTRTNRRDGYVSLEVAPYLAHKTQDTIDEALRLWKAVDRPNLMIKIPGTPAGVPAIETALREGVNVNVTLLFAQEMYEEVAWAYVRALEQRAAKGQDLAGIAGVASFFVSRIDTAVDALIDARLPQANDEQRKLLESVRSKVAIANAKLAYERYQRIFSGPRWDALAAKGAQTQRVLWASTSTKNPKLRDVLYIEELIGKDTVNTIPPATYDAFKDHGRPRASLTEDVEGRAPRDGEPGRGGNLHASGDRGSGDRGREAVRGCVHEAAGGDSAPMTSLTYSLPPELAQAVAENLRAWETGDRVARIWAGDASVWTGTDESQWLGWLRVTAEQLAQRQRFEQFSAEVKAAGFTHVLLLGMGGSSLCPEVLRLSFGRHRRVSRTCTCWIRPTRRRSRPPKRRSTWRARCSLFRASRGRRWSRISSSNTFSNARAATEAGLSPSRTPARRCKRWRSRMASATSFSGCRRLADGIRRCRISA